MDKQTLAVLIDADNVSPAAAQDIFATVCRLGEPIVRRAYGMVNCFSSPEGWLKVQRAYGIVARPQTSNVSGKNVADIALVIDAMELLYRGSCAGICIVSSDSDFTALAAKIREAGKSVYGIGDAKTPKSFRAACTKFFEMSFKAKPAQKKAPSVAEPICPRCGGKLEVAWMKSRRSCKSCAACGGMAVNVEALKTSFAPESIGQIVQHAKAHEEAGCICPNCGKSMSLLKVAVGRRQIEIDVCGTCQTVWYDKDEFESLVPTDGILQANVSAGKTYRRDITLAVAADLRSGRVKAADKTKFWGILRTAYHVPQPDIGPIISALQSQQVIKVSSAGSLSLVAPAQHR